MLFLVVAGVFLALDFPEGGSIVAAASLGNISSKVTSTGRNRRWEAIFSAEGAKIGYGGAGRRGGEGGYQAPVFCIYRKWRRNADKGGGQ